MEDDASASATQGYPPPARTRTCRKTLSKRPLRKDLSRYRQRRHEVSRGLLAGRHFNVAVVVLRFHDRSYLPMLIDGSLVLSGVVPFEIDFTAGPTSPGSSMGARGRSCGRDRG